MRLDVYLQQQYPDVSRAMLQRLIKDGKAAVNDIAETRRSYLVKDSDTVALDFSFETAIQSDQLELEVLYEDKDCVVINKPTGILTHSKGAFNPEETVASWLARRPDFTFADEEGENFRKGIVHRLDRATSGVMIVAKNDATRKHLQKQFHDRKAKKNYVARIEGSLEPSKAIIDVPIERNPKQPQRFRAGHNGKSAQTEYESLQVIVTARGTDSIVKLKPTTGRTHQLRVHLAHLRHPIVGDTFYDGRKANRLFLHAQSLEITIPTSGRRTFTVPTPDSFFAENTL